MASSTATHRSPLIVMRDTRAWQVQVWASFGIAVFLCGTGLAYLPGEALDRRLIETPAAAIETLSHATAGTAALALAALGKTLAEPPVIPADESLDFIARNARDCRRFAGALAPGSREPQVQGRLTAVLHALDHIDRMTERCRDELRFQHLSDVAALAGEAREVRSACDQLRGTLLAGEDSPATRQHLESLARQLESDHQMVRHQVIRAAAHGDYDADKLDLTLDAQRWLRRVTWHAFRVSHYLHQAGRETPPIGQ